MNLNQFLLFGCFVSGALSEDWWYERKKEGSTKCHKNSEYRQDKICLKDGSGYESWACTKNDESEDYNVWVRNRIDRCEKPNTCRCWEDDFYDINCECIYLRKPPSFPPTGVIRWNGTYYQDDSYYTGKEPTTTLKSGEIHKDNSGRFLHKWTEITGATKTVVKFEIIIPVGKKFLRYKGDLSSRSCSKDTVNSEKDLSIIWKKEEKGKAYTLHDTKEKRKGVDTEVWKITEKMDYALGQWEWIVDYDKTKDYAFPRKYKYRLDDSGDVYETKHDYSYTPLGKNDESFRVETYCDI